MNIKEMMGLESFPINECELIRLIAQARSENRQFLELQTKEGKVVKISISPFASGGVMRGNYRLYKKSMYA